MAKDDYDVIVFKVNNNDLYLRNTLKRVFLMFK